MHKTMKTILTIALALFIAGTSYAQAHREAPDGTTVTFVFFPGNDVFFLKGNETELNRLYLLLDEYRAEIAAGTIPVQVDGYCTSLPTVKENLTTAFVRANRVKSELILRKGLKESDFITGNYARAYLNHKDMVVVTLRIPAAEKPTQPEQPEAVKEQPKREESKAEVKPQPKPAVEPQPRPAPGPQPVAEPASEGNTPYMLALRTNLLYDAFLLPTLGVEWRINEHVGVRLDGSLSQWGGSSDKVQKVWLLNPEARWYLLSDKRFYVGVSATYGKYNIYKYPLGSLLSDDTGYQGSLWNAGVTVGYQLRLCRSFSLDFNLGLGYTRSEYDTFAMTDGVRVGKERNKSKSFWGPTQAGVSLVWRLKAKS